MAYSKKRLAFIVSHPIQYYVPLYERLARRDDLQIRVFYTWHAGEKPVLDRGFGEPVAWDIPLTRNYEFELVPNVARDPGTHHFFGLRNPSLVDQVRAWRPDFVHVTGWAGWSHLQAMWRLSREGVPVLFRGDSHLLGVRQEGWEWLLKRSLLGLVYSWPSAFLFVGTANRRYFESLGVDPERLHFCPHSIEVSRFSDQPEQLEAEAQSWRLALGIERDTKVLVFAGKFEAAKRPLTLMRAVQTMAKPGVVLVMVGGGKLASEVRAIAEEDPGRFRVLPFQNQSRMPIVYRLGDLFVLPSESETWGLAVNEALACGRPALVSNRVGCAADLMEEQGVKQFPWGDDAAMMRAVNETLFDPQELKAMGRRGLESSKSFDIACTEEWLMASLSRLGRW